MASRIPRSPGVTSDPSWPGAAIGWWRRGCPGMTRRPASRSASEPMCAICSTSAGATTGTTARSSSATTGVRTPVTVWSRPNPGAFSRFVALAVPPVAALAAGLFSYRQLKRSFYICFIQQVGIAEVALLAARVLGVAVGGLVAGLRRRRRHRRAAPARDRRQHRRMSLPRIGLRSTRTSPTRTRRPKRWPPCRSAGADALSARRRRRGDRRRPASATSAQHFPADGSAAEILDGVGHFLHLEKPELVAAKIADWLGV